MCLIRPMRARQFSVFPLQICKSYYCLTIGIQCHAEAESFLLNIGFLGLK